MRDMLVHASRFAAFPTCGMRFAAQLARLLDTSLTGIFVGEPLVPVGSAGMTAVVIPDYFAANASATEEAIAAEHAFHRWASEEGIASHRWQVASGPFSACLTSASNWHDLLVLECGEKSPWGATGVVGHTLVVSDIPCIVVTDACDRDASLDTIMIASHGRTEAARAVHAALPLLKRARQIVLVQSKSDDTYSLVDFRPEFTIEEHLRRHGLNFEHRAIDVPGERAGYELLGIASDIGADMMVLGAYGRTRMSEWLLGGVTRYMLEHARLPLFMRH